ncbi:hypothetical protein Bpfe_014836 [Biomphalaria pfeifferi]|uniref:Uncharacterized protein n=1 Tax=Biomphalaria pfeifferi TaxID=112525 RepID=A0AAD8BLH3_BIOPF|nr:hypothetical protein Bpfe_014836 [Biomphalaria pfeifferi]
MSDSELWMENNVLKKMILLENKIDELEKKERSRKTMAELEDSLKQFVVDQIMKVKEQLPTIVSEQNKQSQDIKEIKCAVNHLQKAFSDNSKLKYLLPFERGHLKFKDKPSTETEAVCNNRTEVLQTHLAKENVKFLNFKSELEKVKSQNEKIMSCLKLFESPEDDLSQNPKGKHVIAEHSIKIKDLEKALEHCNKNLKSEIEKVFQRSDKRLNKTKKELKKTIVEEKKVLSEQIKILEDDVNNTYEKFEVEIQQLQPQMDVTNQIDKLSFGLDSLCYQLSDLEVKMTELQMDFVRLKNFQDSLGISLSGTQPFSNKEVITFMMDIGSKYEVMKALLIQRVDRLENLRQQLAKCNNSAQKREELEKKLVHLTACVENLQLFILAQDKPREDLCLQDFDKYWPKSPSMFDFSQLNLEHIIPRSE